MKVVSDEIREVIANSSPERYPVSPHILQRRNKNLQEKQQAWQVSLMHSTFGIQPGSK
jgi:FtsZ-binding cell division protein ZapB